MKRRRLLLAAALVALFALLALLAPFLFVRTHDSVFREPHSGRPYRVIVREDHDAERPRAVLFLLHGYAAPPEPILRGYWLRALAVRRRNMILVIPEGRRDSSGNLFWNATRACCGANASALPDDLGYLRDVLADVRRRYAVDPTKVLALGVSNGGFMAYRWACEKGSELSAFASISGAGPGPDDPVCTPDHPITLLALHGDRDEIVAYAGGRMNGSLHPSARASLTPFLRALRSNGLPSSEIGRNWLGETLHKEEWRGPGARVALWTLQGAGHVLRTGRLGLSQVLDYLVP